MSLIINIEGCEGTGKSTVSKALYKKLATKYENVLLSKEPGGTELGNKIRSLILDNKMDTITETFLYLADRASNYESIKPVLKNDGIVIKDRSLISTLVYQGYAKMKCDNKFMLILYNCHDFMFKNSFSDIENDITSIDVLLRCDPIKALKRKQQDEINRFELEGEEFHKKIAKGYNQIIKMSKNHIVVNVEDKTVDEIVDEIIGRIKINEISEIKSTKIMEGILEKVKEGNQKFEDDILDYLFSIDVNVLSSSQKEEVADLLERHGIEVGICDQCGKFMLEGYVIDQGAEYYCDDECMLKKYSKEEMDEILKDADEDGDSYWTEFN